MRHAFELDGVEHEVWLARADWPHDESGGVPQQRRLHTADGAVPVMLRVDARGLGMLMVDGSDRPVAVATRGDEVFVHLDGQTYALRHRHPLDRAAAEAHGGGEDEARAPMPGTVVALLATPGQAVVRGEPLLVMESMKLETTIAAWRDGVVHEVRVAVGQVFERDAVLVTLEPPP